MKIQDEILVLNNDEDKKCGRCGRVLPASHFYKKSASKDHLQHWCIDCMKDYSSIKNMNDIARKNKILNSFFQAYRELEPMPIAVKMSVVGYLRKLINRLDREIKKEVGYQKR